MLKNNGTPTARFKYQLCTQCPGMLRLITNLSHIDPSQAIFDARRDNQVNMKQSSDIVKVLDTAHQTVIVLVCIMIFTDWSLHMLSHYTVHEQ